MKTIRECAEICNCSKTSITRLIKQLNIITVQDKNRLLVSDEDVEKLQQHVANIAPNETKTAPKIETNETENATQPAKNAPKCTKSKHIETKIATFSTNRNTTQNADIISIYCETIEILKEQLKQKDKQIQNLQEENKLLIQSNAFSLKQLEEKNKAEAVQKQEPDIKVYVEKSKETPPAQEIVKKKRKFILSWFK